MLQDSKYKAFRREMLGAALAKTNGNRSRAALDLGISVQTIKLWLSEEPALADKWPATHGRPRSSPSTATAPKSAGIDDFLGRLSDRPAIRNMQIRYISAIAKANGNIAAAARELGLAGSSLYHWVRRHPQLKVRETWPNAKGGHGAEAGWIEDAKEETVAAMSDERRKELDQKVQLSILNLKGAAYTLLSKATDAEVAQATKDTDALARLGVLTAEEAAELEAAKRQA